MAKINKFNESIDILSKIIKSGVPSWKWMSELRKTQDCVPDGVWDISDIEFLDPIMPSTKKWVKSDSPGRGSYVDLPNANELIDDWEKRLTDFITKYPNFVIADAYQTEYPLFLSEKPTKSVKYIGSGFNHGSNNIVDNCPKRILICGEDD